MAATLTDIRFECGLLEAELGTKGDAKVVVRAAVEKNVIAGFEAQADGSGKSFDSTARV